MTMQKCMGPNWEYMSTMHYRISLSESQTAVTHIP